ncbi:Spy/CpxP family protein refolding chaperone [Thaumasiovibrio sp. DFM-14]|uniref:Spy/CpxP family protein refolding chaperone n=1 Tax=Thaumasiovibrio sp. DFM-14 TaxID=3384792 RepID=UPI0039A21D90
MKNKTLIAVAVAIPLLATSIGALAFGGPQGGKGQRDFCSADMSRGLQQLDLSDAQKKEIDTLRENFRAESAQDNVTRQAVRDTHREAMHALMLAPEFDHEAAQQLAQQMTGQQQQRRIEMLEQRHALMSVLTDEQKQTLLEQQQNNMETYQDRKGKRDGRRQNCRDWW